MKTRSSFIYGSVLALLLVGPGATLAGDTEAEDAAAGKQVPSIKLQGKEDVAARGVALPLYRPPVPPKAPSFVPPKRGKPAGRVGGGSRDTGGDAWPVLAALVPEHVGRTVSDQPSLFWYIDAVPKAGTQLVFALIDEDSVEPIREISLDAPAQAGVQRISLSAYGVKLEPGVEYEWSVALVVDPEQRSNDIIASGWIDRLKEAPEGLESRTQEGAATSAVNAYAELGLWYDALSAISDLIDQNPGDALLKQIRAALLQQVGLGEVARAEL
jgi:hypothetical protein